MPGLLRCAECRTFPQTVAAGEPINSSGDGTNPAASDGDGQALLVRRSSGAQHWSVQDRWRGFLEAAKKKQNYCKYFKNQTNKSCSCSVITCNRRASVIRSWCWAMPLASLMTGRSGDRRTAAEKRAISLSFIDIWFRPSANVMTAWMKSACYATHNKSVSKTQTYFCSWKRVIKYGNKLKNGVFIIRSLRQRWGSFVVWIA